MTLKLDRDIDSDVVESRKSKSTGPKSEFESKFLELESESSASGSEFESIGPSLSPIGQASNTSPSPSSKNADSSPTQ